MTASVLVYSMGEVIGDGLIKLPFVAGLRAAFPQARISWCAAKGSTVYAGALKAVVERLIDEVVTDGPTGAGPFDWLPWVKPFGGRIFDPPGKPAAAPAPAPQASADADAALRAALATLQRMSGAA